MLLRGKQIPAHRKVWHGVERAWQLTEPVRPHLARLAYATLLAYLVHLITQGRPALAGVPGYGWAAAVGVVAALRPAPARLLLALVAGAALASTSLAIAAVIVGGSLVAVVLAPEGEDQAVPVRFATLVATPLAALNNLAFLPLSIGVAVGGRAFRF